MRVCVDFQWQAAGDIKLDENGRLVFPPLPTMPGIYRIRLSGEDRVSNYIGEGFDLRKRAALYRTGARGQTTNYRMNARMHEHLEPGGTIQLSIATEAVLTIDGEHRPADMRRKATRLLVEAAAIQLVPNAEGIENLPGIGDRTE